MARMMHILHICFRPHLLLLYFVSMVAAIGIAVSSLGSSPSVTKAFLMGFFEVFGSIAVVLGLHHVLTVDSDDGAQEVLLTYPTSRLMLAVERIIAGFFLAAGPLLLLAGGYQVFLAETMSERDFVALSMKSVMVDSVVSWVFLGGLALLASVLAGNWIAGLLVAGFYWVVDFVSSGQFTSNLYLFYGTYTPQTLSPTTNRLMLSIFGMSACIAATLIYGRLSSRR